MKDILDIPIEITGECEGTFFHGKVMPGGGFGKVVSKKWKENTKNKGCCGDCNHQLTN